MYQCTSNLSVRLSREGVYMCMHIYFVTVSECVSECD